jgi:hypothetical protein
VLDRRRFSFACALGGVAAALPGCYSIQELPASELPAAGARQVMVVGRIEVVPQLRRDQDLRIGNDVFNMKRHLENRAVLVMGARAEAVESPPMGAQILNPTLEETYFLLMRRSERFLAKGSVTMEWSSQVTGPRTMSVDSVELKFPAPLELDIQPGDQAIYIGTLRLHRDRFHTLLGAEVLDHHAAAQPEFQQRFGAQARLRKALLKLPGAAPSRPAPRTRST